MLRLVGIRKVYATKRQELHALSGIDAEFRSCGLVAVTGPSGSGKTTLLNIIGGFERPTSGEVVLDGAVLSGSAERGARGFPAPQTACIRKSSGPLCGLTVYENILLSFRLAGAAKGAGREKAVEIMEFAGIADAREKTPELLSPLKRQKTALAMALARGPEVLLADEPTGMLDFESGFRFMQLLKNVSKDRLVIIATDSIEIARQFADRVIVLADGRIESDSQPMSLNTVNLAGRRSPEREARRTGLPAPVLLRLALRGLAARRRAAGVTVLAEAMCFAALSLIQRCFSPEQRHYAITFAVTLVALAGAVIGFSTCLDIRDRARELTVLREMGAAENTAFSLISADNLLIGAASGLTGAAAAAVMQARDAGRLAALFGAGVILAWTAGALAMLCFLRERAEQ